MNSVSGRYTHATAALTLALAMLVSTSGLDAQRRGAGGRAAVGGGGVERAIRLADELELTADQRMQLEAIRVEILEQRTAQTTAMLALRSEVAAGIREPEAVREVLADRLSAARATGESVRDRLGEILTDEQEEEFRGMNRRAMWRQRGMRDRSGIEGQRGWRGGRGFDRSRGRDGRRGRSR